MVVMATLRDSTARAGGKSAPRDQWIGRGLGSPVKGSDLKHLQVKEGIRGSRLP